MNIDWNRKTNKHFDTRIQNLTKQEIEKQENNEQQVQ